jgi:hypothetical protein
VAVICQKCGKEITEGAGICPHCNHVQELSSDFDLSLGDPKPGKQPELSIGVNKDYNFKDISLGEGLKTTLSTESVYRDFERLESLESNLNLPLFTTLLGNKQVVLNFYDNYYTLVEFDNNESRVLPFKLDAEESDITSIAILPDNKIVMCDRMKSELILLSPGGEQLGIIGKEGNLPGEFDSPEWVSALADGRLLVADAENHRIQVISQAGESLGIYPSGAAGDHDLEDYEGDMEGQFSLPIAVESIPGGGFAVLENGNNRVQTLGADGSYRLHFGEYGDNPGFFNDPRYLAVSPTGFIFVGDRGGKRIQKFDPMGEFVYALIVSTPDEIACGNFIPVGKDDLWVTFKKEKKIVLIRKV